MKVKWKSVEVKMPPPPSLKLPLALLLLPNLGITLDMGKDEKNVVMYF